MRRPSADEDRARELAIAAALDPDARMARPGEAEGGRGWPAWCAFRDAARAERTDTAIAAVQRLPQAAAYADAPLTVFGPHEAGTLGQMRNCMGVGNVVAGVSAPTVTSATRRSAAVV